MCVSADWVKGFSDVISSTVSAATMPLWLIAGLDEREARFNRGHWGVGEGEQTHPIEWPTRTVRTEGSMDGEGVLFSTSMSMTRFCNLPWRGRHIHEHILL